MNIKTMLTDKLQIFITLLKSIEKNIRRELGKELFSGKLNSATGKMEYRRLAQGASTERAFLEEIKLLRSKHSDVKTEFRINEIQEPSEKLKKYQNLLVSNIEDTLGEISFYGFQDENGNFIEQKEFNSVNHYSNEAGVILYYNIIAPEGLKRPLKKMSINQISLGLCVALRNFILDSNHLFSQETDNYKADDISHKPKLKWKVNANQCYDTFRQLYNEKWIDNTIDDLAEIIFQTVKFPGKGPNRSTISSELKRRDVRPIKSKRFNLPPKN